MTLPEERKVQAKLAVKDEYTFDFAELSPVSTNALNQMCVEGEGIGYTDNSRMGNFIMGNAVNGLDVVT